MTDELEVWNGPVVDSGQSRPVLRRDVQFVGNVWEIVSDVVDFGTSSITRDIQLHPGAVAIIALDDQERVLLIRQYRHPVGMYLFEPPAGVLDVTGEPARDTAARELAEEAGLVADEWHVLVDLFNSPGGSSEAIRIYLARGLHEIAGGRHRTGEAEEAFLPQAWVDLDEARALVMSGKVGSPHGVAGVLAAWSSRTIDWSDLRQADAPWPARDHLVASDRVFLRPAH
ncbi:MAG: NUDIX hydrolase [bacterium]|nr:NUDIX hydrolase [bacterium]